MKIAITADVHLTDKAKHLSRANALRNILVQCKQLDVGALIIAGDLFDKDTSNPSILEQIVKEEMPLPFDITILPGNHDHRLNNDLFSDQLPINVIEETTLNNTDFGVDVLMVPYGLERRMGSELSKFRENFKKNRYVLISHGDLPDQVTVKNEYESGVYMPLYKRDLNEFSPKRVFLGHIHIPSPIGDVMYPGSPCGLDISETGSRSFILYDTETDVVEKIKISTDMIYFNENLTLIPGDTEEQQIDEFIAKLMKRWQGILENNCQLVLRITVFGYSNQRGSIETKLKERLSRIFSNIVIESINTDELFAHTDGTLDQAIGSVKERIDNFKFDPPDPELMPDKDEIMRASLNIMFGVK